MHLKKLTGSLEASKDSAGAGDPSACQSVGSVVESHTTMVTTDLSVYLGRYLTSEVAY